MNRSVKTCLEIMEYLVRHDFTQNVSQREVEKAITIIRGSDPRTLRNWMKALTVRGYLERSMHSPMLFRMDLTRCPQLLTECLRGDRQKKLL